VNHDTYFQYLCSRSTLGLFYRRWFLYPRLRFYLTGEVLDVGCGLGDFVASRPGTVGVDINPNTVAYCIQRGLPAHLMTDGRLPFAESRFDGVVLDNVLEHLTEPSSLLREIHRVLKHHGTLLVGVPGECGYASDPDHKVYYDARRLVDELSSAGFVMRKLFYVPWQSTLLNKLMRQYCLYGVFERG
jgi:SAM-dependent methyltransferase